MFHDENGDGELGDEPGIANVRLTVQELSSGTEVEKLTDDDGYFQFDNLLPGTYLLTEEQPDGWGKPHPVGQLALYVTANHSHQANFAHQPPPIWLPLYRK